MEDQEAYQRAKRRMKAKFGFYRHLGIYLGVNVLLVLINLGTSAEYIWFKWPLMGWGIGVFFHGMSVFGPSSGTIAQVKKRMIANELKQGSAQDSRVPRNSQTQTR